MSMHTTIRPVIAALILFVGEAVAVPIAVESTSDSAGNGVFSSLKNGLSPETGNKFYGYTTGSISGYRTGVVYKRFSSLGLHTNLQAGVYTLTMRVASDGSQNWPGIRSSTNVSGYACGFFTTAVTGNSLADNGQMTLNHMVDFNNTPGVSYKASSSFLSDPDPLPLNSDMAEDTWYTVAFTWSIAPDSSVVGTDPLVGLGFELGHNSGGAVYIDDSTLTFTPHDAGLLIVEPGSLSIYGNGVFDDYNNGLNKESDTNFFGYSTISISGYRAGVAYTKFSNLGLGFTNIQSGTYRLEMRVASNGQQDWPGIRDMNVTNSGSGFCGGFFSTLGSGSTDPEKGKNTLNSMVSFNNSSGVDCRVESSLLTTPVAYPLYTNGMAEDVWRSVVVTWVVGPGSSVVGTDPYVGLGFEVGNNASGAVFFDDSLLTYTADCFYSPKTLKSICKTIGEYPGFGSLMGAEWYYNWGTVAGTTNLPNIEYVPMIYGPKTNGVVDANALRTVVQTVLTNYPDCKNLLGFNEPNHTNQSNISVTNALAVWPVIQEELAGKNIRLGSPGVVGITAHRSEWLDPFMAGVISNGYRVDFICVHRRVSCGNTNAAQTVADECKEIFADYHLPIWITEMELVDSSSSSPTEAQILTFWQDWADILENDPSMAGVVERYSFAYATTNSTEDYKVYAVPVDAGGELTPAGRCFQRLHEPQ